MSLQRRSGTCTAMIIHLGRRGTYENRAFRWRRFVLPANRDAGSERTDLAIRRKARQGRLGGRKAWPKNFKKELVEAQGSRCAVCMTAYQPRELQIDHRVPYEVGGEPEGISNLTDFMGLCGSCNRAKSWSCEHCRNWTDEKDEDICRTCYWADPETYVHIALRLIRRLDITWTDAEITEYDRLVTLSKQAQEDLPEFVKSVIRNHVG